MHRAVVVALALFAPRLVQAQDVAYHLIVHASNPVARLSRDQVSRIFLRKVTQWDNHQPVLPIDQTAESPVRLTFTKQVHQRTIASVQTWWQQQTFAGVAVAPPERASDSEVLDYVRKYPGAIGYVRAGVPFPPDVKAIDLQP
ncbi:MAG: substrate-binding domain-containing protein [Gemmatimonadales bacterium]